MQNATRIHGKWYDLSKFALLHPGGITAIQLALGRDSTILFEAHHPFASRNVLAEILLKYEIKCPVGIPDLILNGMDADAALFSQWGPEKSLFAKELTAQVRLYFLKEAKRRGVSFTEATKATPTRKLTNAALYIALIFSIYHMCQGSLTGLLSVSVFGWLCIGHTFHDLSHFSFSTHPELDHFLSYLFPYFTSPTTWHYQHLVGHHCYPNIAHKDPDINHTPALRRDNPQHKWHPAHETQHTLPNLAFNWGWAILLGLNIGNELRMCLEGSYNSCVPVRMSRLHMVGHLGYRSLVMNTILTWPFFLLLDVPVTTHLLFAVAPMYLMSLFFMLNTQINHLAPHMVVISVGPGADWYAHQVQTAQDFGGRLPSNIYFMLSGGLNCQIEHHLFPTVNSCHLESLRPLVEACCVKHLVKYTRVGMWEAVIGYWTHTRDMARSSKDEPK